MLRAIYLSRAQPAARNLFLVTKRFQQSSPPSGSATTASTKSTPGSSITQSATSNPSSATKTQTASTKTSSNAPIDRSNNPQKTTTTPPPSTPPPSSKTVPPSSSSSYPASSSSGGSGGTVKAIVYGVALGLGVTLLYAEYDNGSFRRKVESTLPLSSTILSGLDKIIDPVFGRQKKLTTIISEKLPDISVVTNKLPDKDQIKKAGEQVKDAANTLYNKLPDQKQIQKAGEQAKDAINDAYDKLPEYKKVKGAVTHAADQVKFIFKRKENIETILYYKVKDAAHSVRDAAKSVKDTVKDALPTTKGVSGEQSRRGNDPVFLEEAGEMITKPPLKP
jgi:hypothetical protein